MEVSPETARTPISEITREDLLAELAAAIPQPPGPDEITATMLMEKTGRGYQFCKRYLDGKVKAGEMVGREAIDNGRAVMAYKKITPA